MQALNIDVSAKAHIGLFEGNLSTKFTSVDSLDEKSFSIILKGRIEFNPENKKGVLKLTQKGQDLLKNSGTEAGLRSFYRAAGTKVVSSQTRAASISVIYTYHATTKEKRSNLKVAMSARHGAMTGSVNLMQELSSTDKTARLTVIAHQEGVSLSGSNILDLLSTDPGNFAAIRTKLAESLKAISFANCPVESFVTVDVADNFSLEPFRDPFLTGRLNRILERIYFEYQRGMQQAALARRTLAGLQNSDFAEDGKSQLKEFCNKIDDRLEEIEDKGNALLSNPDTKLVLSEEVEIPWNDMLSGNWLDVQGWSITSSASRWWNNYHWTAFAEYTPNVMIRKLPLLTGGTLFRDGIPVEPLSLEELSKIAMQSGSFRDIYTIRHTASPDPLWFWEGAPYAETAVTAKNIALGQGNESEKSARYTIEIYTSFGETKTISFGGYGSS